MEAISGGGEASHADDDDGDSDGDGGDAEPLCDIVG